MNRLSAMSIAPPARPAALGGRERLRIATQKSGRIGEPARALLGRAGLSFRESRDRLFCFGESLPVDLLLVRDDDIPGLIAEGMCDLGIVGRNVLQEQCLERDPGGNAPPLRELVPLGFGGCRLSLAIPQERSWQGPRDLRGLRIATSYPRLLGRWLQGHGVEADIVVLSGSVEIAPRLGKADAVCDLVSSGATLAANQLREVEVVLESEAVLAAPSTAFVDARAELAELLLRRIRGLSGQRDSKLVMLQAPRSAVVEILRLLPDADPPSVMALEGSSDVALQTVCRATITWQHLEDAKRAGARQVLVLPVERMLA